MRYSEGLGRLQAGFWRAGIRAVNFRHGEFGRGATRCVGEAAIVKAALDAPNSILISFAGDSLGLRDATATASQFVVERIEKFDWDFCCLRLTR